MTHEGLPHFLHDPGFHEPRVEGVAQIVKSVIADFRSAYSRRPCGFDPVERSAFEEEHESLFFWHRREEFKEASGDRNLPSLTARRFRVSDKEQPTGEIDVFPPLTQQFPSPHAGVEGGDDERVEVWCRL